MIYLLSTKNIEFSKKDIRKQNYIHCLKKKKISPGERNGNPLQYSCLENSTDRGAWWATVHGITKELDTTKQQALIKRKNTRMFRLLNSTLFHG